MYLGYLYIYIYIYIYILKVKKQVIIIYDSNIENMNIWILNVVIDIINLKNKQILNWMRFEVPWPSHPENALSNPFLISSKSLNHLCKAQTLFISNLCFCKKGHLRLILFFCIFLFIDKGHRPGRSSLD